MNDIADFFSWNRKYLIYNLVIRNLKVRYRKSVFGFLWTLLVPAAMACVYVFVFKYIARLGDENYALFILSGVIPWTFVSTALFTGTDSMISNFGILSKVPISISAFPLAETCSAFVNLLLSIPILIIAALFYGVYPSWAWLSLPLIFSLLFLQAYGLSLLLAIANVYLRDVRHLVSIFIQIWMYLTPILYAKELIPPDKLKWFYLNPLFSIFDSIHTVLIKGILPGDLAFAHMAAWSFLLLAVAFFVNRNVRFRLVEKI